MPRMGRKPGSKNLANVERMEFRERFRTRLDENKFFEELKTLRGFAYVKNYLAALEFAEPKLARHTIEGAPDGKPILVISIPYDPKNPPNAPNIGIEAPSSTEQNQDSQIGGGKPQTKEGGFFIDV